MCECTCHACYIHTCEFTAYVYGHTHMYMCIIVGQYTYDMHIYVHSYVRTHIPKIDFKAEDEGSLKSLSERKKRNSYINKI